MWGCGASPKLRPMNEPTSLTAVAVLDITPTSVRGRLTVEGVDTRTVRSEHELLEAIETMRDLVLHRLRETQLSAA
jgi:hypothetical protein